MESKLKFIYNHMRYKYERADLDCRELDSVFGILKKSGNLRVCEFYFEFSKFLEDLTAFFLFEVASFNYDFFIGNELERFYEYLVNVYGNKEGLKNKLVKFRGTIR